MNDLELYRATGLDRFTTQGRTVARRLREVDGEAVIRARAVARAEDLALLQAQLRAAGGGQLYRAIARQVVQTDALISAVSEGKPGVELNLRKMEEILHLGLTDLLAGYMTRG
ncbi:hypothetical protein [Pseudofrankia saprophytica]|uniref:hypothetical protein n=1 Tax=Pseudofrankia saprophytica TaxID=298655 RepID=UPI000234C849|nr:hypothetical protein [Pseudofrankia saprophytica]